MTTEEFIAKVSETNPWTARWWRLGQVVVQAGDKAWEVKDLEQRIPENLKAAGCTGKCRCGRWDYVFWDLDIGHGSNGYGSLGGALHAARRLAKHLDGYREVRLSKSGKGVHVRQMFEQPKSAEFDFKEHCLGWAKELEIRVDASPIGRQVQWLYTPEPRPARAFEEVEVYG